ncbi:MAG: SpoIIE family protein phosphatase, partial [Bacteroidales bacterium]|nr:SpoIIE family protein phosphatase [Bacteroidales bacterium]
VFIPSDELFVDLYNLNRKLLILGSIGIVLLLILIIFISHRLTKPLTKLAKITQTIGAGNFNANTQVSNASKEIVQLGNSINQMQSELKNYIKNLKETTAAKEKIESELKIAHDIQQGIIPKIFPPFPERDDIDLFAVLDPARDVGGDLYDFFFIDDHKICFAIGDVSGKGVPASLFMAITRTLLRSKATKNSSAKEIVSELNIELCKGNENSMFVTFFLCIMDTKTGIVEFCNAGHNYPFIIRNNNKINCIEETHGTPIGIFDYINYESGTFQLSNNESIVLYTDGVTEAMDIDNNLYGDERLIGLLAKSKDHHPKVITKTIVDDVNKFVGKAEQSDDITILILSYFLNK